MSNLIISELSQLENHAFKPINKKIEVIFEKQYEENNGLDERNNSNYINMANPEGDIAHLKFPNEIVIPMRSISIRYTYPLSKEERYI